MTFMDSNFKKLTNKKRTILFFVKKLINSIKIMQNTYRTEYLA